MKNYTLFKVILALLIFFTKTTNASNDFSIVSKKNSISKKNILANTAPIITATGNQIYCPQTNIKIATSVNIVDPDDTSTDEIYIQISTGYIYGQDQLTLSGIHPTITTSWDVTAGKLRLYSPSGIPVSYLDFIAAIKDVEFNNSSVSPSGIRNFSISIGQANYLPSTQHYYQFISNIGITWTNAKVAAETSAYFGLQGYLATILAADEAQISGKQAAGAGWIGGSDAVTEGDWKWVTGPEGLANGGTGVTFWNGLSNGTTPNFALWNTGEPNQSGDEDYAHITAPGIGIQGSWNDLSNTGNTIGNYQPKGYIVEYGGMPGDPILQISASTTITIPEITTITPTPICGSGTFTLQATSTSGIINWYDVPAGGISLGNGTSYTTPSINTTTTYYADNGCPIRSPIIATINAIPTITSTSPASVCDAGTVTLGAAASAGTINWYNGPTGGTALGTGISFITPNIAATTTFYVDATASGCTTATRTAIAATVNISPSITSTTPASRCDSGTVTLQAGASSGIINWYYVPTGGTALGTGTSFTTPSIATTTNYYVDTTNQCTSPRVPVVAAIYPIVKINEEVILCQTKTATLDASIPGMNYLWMPGGETTQTIVVSTIGDYSVTISNPFVAACDSNKYIKVIEHPAPIINAIIVNENSITIELETPENYYEFSIDGELFQDSNQFSYIPSGEHKAYVREKNRCNLIQQDFTIFTIAKYFTPNNDGFNDVWEIKEMKNYPNSSALIFNRYGKLITTLSALKYSWNGRHNNNALPADDYWYVLKIDDTTPEKRGHFSLKR